MVCNVEEKEFRVFIVKLLTLDPGSMICKLACTLLVGKIFPAYEAINISDAMQDYLALEKARNHLILFSFRY